ncbi:MAG: hypothetical protein RIR09_2336 [Pseudomonadota bacterium]
MKRWVFIVGLVLTMGLARAAERVPVGVYPFLPFSTRTGGITQELVEAMNRFQTEYVFQLVQTSANRRYRDMERGAFQVIFFENIKWGWDARDVEATRVYLAGDGEVYVARSAPQRTQAYFESLSDKQLLLVTGYHYGFANHVADPDVLRQSYQVTYSPDGDISLRNLLQGRGDIAVVTKSYLAGYLKDNPQAAERLLVYDRYDQYYAHTALVKKGTRPSAEDIDKLLTRMRAAGVLQQLWSRHGLDKFCSPKC